MTSLDRLTFFETDRLVFRRFEPADLDALAVINADAEVSRFVGDGQPLDRATTAMWIENSRRNVASHGYGTGAVEEKATGALVGWAGVARPDDGGEEIIYGFAKSHWGKGLGTEVLRGLIKWARDVLALTELRATVYPANAASIALLTRTGFALEDSALNSDPDTQLYVIRLH